MKAGSKFLNAVSAVAISAGVAASGAGAVLLVSAGYAEAAVVKRIDVKGAARVGAEAVRANITIQPGKTFSNADIDESVKRLYATGYFSDVRISVSGGALVVSVNENQLVNQVVFNGNRKLKDEKLQAVVQTQALAPYSQSQIDSDIARIKEAYAAIGRNDVQVTTETFAVANGRVNLAFVVNEGDRTKIGKIEFVGNNAYSDGRLASVISTKKSNFLSFLTRRDIYSEAKMRADEETLRQFYYNHGYPDFRIVSGDATFDANTNEYTLTYTVEEGPRYNFGAVGVESTVSGVDANELQGLVRTHEGSTYNARDVQKTMEAISTRVAAEGYPFARVTPRGNRDFSSNTVGVSYIVDQGERAYVERIEIRGNTRTRDYVIRREFDLAEGDAFNQTMITRAKRRLEALGYFESVNVSTAPGSSPDRVVIVVDVKDQSTGAFGVGAGYSAGSDSILLEASVEEKNFLGRGQYIRLAAGGGTDDARSFNLSFTEPYFLGYRLAAGFDLFRSSSSSEDFYDYEETGGTLRVTAPITEDLSTTFSYTYKQMKYDATGNWDEDVNGNKVGSPGFNSDKANLSSPYRDLVGNDWVQSSVANKLNYNTLDSQTAPHEGIQAQLTQEFAGLGGDSDFYKISAKARAYYTLSDEADLIGSLTVQAGHVMPTSGDLKVFDQFMIGGKQIRGFENGGIGPRMNNGDALGGTSYITASAETTFPMPGIPQDFGLRGALFADAGTLFGNEVDTGGEGHSTTSAKLRASLGVGVTWASPFGPLRFDYAVPVMKEDYDKTQNFRFSIANQF